VCKVSKNLKTLKCDMQDYFDKLRGRLYPRHFHYSYYGVLMCYYKMIASSTKSDVLYRWDSKKATHKARDCEFESPHLACVYFVWLVWGKRSWVCIFAPHTHIFHVKIAWLVIWDECTCVGASQDFVNIFFCKTLWALQRLITIYDYVQLMYNTPMSTLSSPCTIHALCHFPWSTWAISETMQSSMGRA
jgi:hypothetical protein